VQRCRTHKLRNVRDHLPPHLQAQVTSAMRAAFRLKPQEGIAKLCAVKALSEMGEGPPESACRSRFQTTPSCEGKEPWW
jgi:hypothetical protein